MANIAGYKEEATVDDLIRVIGRQTVRIVELETENASLRPQANAVKSGNGEAPEDDSKSSTDNPPTRNNESSLQRLSRSHADLLARHERLERDFVSREKKYREAKNLVKQWSKYIRERLSSSVLPKTSSEPHKGLEENEHLTHGKAEEHSEASISFDDADKSEGEVHAPALPEYTSGAVKPTEVSGHERTTDILDYAHQSRQVTSSQTTESIEDVEDTPRASIKREPSSDDAPFVVSARQLKRKANTPIYPGSPRRIKIEPASPGRNLDVNSQTLKGPPQSLQPLQRQETSDLDAIGSNLKTPRKPKPNLHLHRGAASDDSTRLRPYASHERSTSDARSRINEAISPKRMHDAKNIPKNTQQIMASSDHDRRKTQHRGSPLETALQPLSVNVPTARPIRANTKASKPVCDEVNAKIKVEPAENGDGARKRMEDMTRSNEHVEPAEARLSALLADHTPARTPLAGESRKSAVRSRNEKERVVESTPNNKIADKHGDTVDRRKARVGTRASHGTSTPAAHEKRPLRSRSVGSLRLDDFKINPHYLGTDFAYVDTTMRGREQRRAMTQTCNRPDCCGETFRRVIEIGGTSVSGKSDAAALEEYLGPAWERMLHAYGPEKRHDVLVEAHVHCFARKHGRHRHAFERRNTPPGYWRTDMPTTQEEEEDRARARQVERRKVEERWREAMRDGGRWVFRDE